MQVPGLKKFAINRGVNGAVNDKKLVDIALDELTTITGQKAVATMSKKDISNFKCVKTCRLVQELRYVAKRCMSFWIV